VPIVNDDFNRTVTRLDLAPERSGIFTPEADGISFTESELQRFNDCVGKVAPNTPPLDAAHLAAAARRLSRVVGAGRESRFIRTRLRRAGEIRALLADASWTCDETLRGRMRELIAYIDDGPGLVPDDAPLIGGLDDALLVDLAMESLRGELDDYADFCRYRVGEAARLGVAAASATLNRNSWAMERGQELHMERLLRRAFGATYAKPEDGGGMFRVR
jgi:hypothetical protein